MTVLDTNVLIYACDKSDPERQEKALALIDRVTNGTCPPGPSDGPEPRAGASDGAAGMMAAALHATALVFVLFWAHTVAAQVPAEEAALTRLIEQWEIARNAHDAEAMRSVFDLQVDQIRLPDGEVIAADQDGLVRWFDAGFKRDGNSSTARVDSTRVRVISPDVGLVDVGFTLLGTSGQTLIKGHATFVCTKREQGWKVTALRFASAAPK